MKNILRAAILVLLLAELPALRAQTPACPAVSLPAKVVLPCGQSCTTLRAAATPDLATTSYKVNPITYNPAFAFNAGTQINLRDSVDDRWSGIINLPFTFCFFGNSYNQVIVGANGVVSFNVSHANGDQSWEIPAGGIPYAFFPDRDEGNTIMAPWQDMDPTYKGKLYYASSGVAPCRQFAVSWYQVALFGDPNSRNTGFCTVPDNETQQVVLYETSNIIDINIQNKSFICNNLHNTDNGGFPNGYWNNGWAVEGIQNAAGTVAYTVPGRNATQWTATNDAYRFSPAGASRVTYTWFSGATQLGTADTLKACPNVNTTYTVSAIYTNCDNSTYTASATTQVVVDNLTVTIDSVNNPTCGNTNGAVYASYSSNAGVVSFGWSPGGASQTSLTNLGAGTYIFTVLDSAGCTKSDTVTLVNGAGPIVTVPNDTIISCSNVTNNGTLTANVTGGTSPFVYTWSNGQHSKKIVGLAAGTYTVTVSDKTNCSGTGSGTVVIIPNQLTFNNPSITDVTCNGDSNGSITASANGIGTVSYTWNTGATGATINGLKAGSYTVTATDSLGCSATATYAVNQSAAITFGPPVIINSTCKDSSGSITVNASGGTGNITYTWNNGSTGATITGLNGGSYTVTATDNLGCTASATYSVGQSAPIVFGNPGIVNVSCHGDSTGSITANATGGNGTISYVWNTGATTNTITHLAAGSYTVTASDTAGCSATAQYTVSQPKAIVLTKVIVNVTPCFGDSTGSITANATGGTGTLSYTWSTGATTKGISGLAAGTYKLTVTDLSGCTASATYLVKQPTAVTFGTPVITNVSCGGDSTGSITVNASGGTGTITYVWNTGTTGATISNLSAGTYTVTASDSLGCSDTASYTIIQSQGITFGVALIANTGCSIDTGSITVTTLGGTGTVTYVWNTSATGATITGLAPGSYSVTATDSLGCSAAASYTVGQITNLAFGLPIINNAACGQDNGSITVTTTGGVGTVGYEWNIGGIKNTLDSLAAGTYTVTATDSLGCTVSASYTVGQNTSLTLDSAIIINTTCFGDSTGSILVSASNATGTVIYVWNTGATTAFISGLAAGSYSVTATDSLGCSVAATYTVGQPLAVTFGPAIINNTACSGTNNGSITVNATGGTGTITYAWNTGPTTATITGLGTGTYTVTATDSLGCSATASYNINQSPGVTFGNPVITDAGCNGGNTGSIIVSATGGTGPITYVWGDNSTSDTLSGLAPGTYNVTATDSLGCSASAAYTVNQGAGVTFGNPVITDATCGSANGGSILVTTTGGTGTISYMWNTGVTTNPITGLGAGLYSVTATDTAGCSASTSYLINQSSSLIFGAPVITNATCNGDSTGSITAVVTGGAGTITYAWDNGGTGATITNLAAGNYTVTATDTSGCSGSQTYTVGQPSAITFGTPSIDSITCFGAANGSITANATGGTGTINYVWGNTVTGAFINNLAPGQYCVTATDSAGCSASICYIISQPDTLVIDTAIITNASCVVQSSIALTISGGTQAYSYTWTGGLSGNPASNVPAGSYSVTVTDFNGCTATGGAYTVLSSGGGVVFDSAIIVNPACNGAATGSITASAHDSTGSPITYNWDNGSTGATISGLAAGTYCVTASDTSGCSASTCYTISQPGAITFGTPGLVLPACNGDSSGCIQVNATGGTGTITFTWADGTPGNLLCGIPAGSYTVTATDSAGCTASMTFQLGQPLAITFSNNIVDSITCNNAANGSITASASGGTGPITYSWNTLATGASISNLAPGTYCVTATDSLGCSGSVCFTLNNPPLLTIDSAVITPGTCIVGGSITVFASGGTGVLNYSWSGNLSGNPITNLAAGTYTLTLSDANGCSTTATYQVTAIAGAITFGTPTINNPACSGGTGSITVVASDSGGLGGTITYAWNDGETTATISGLQAGNYCVTATDSAGCSASVCYNITPPSPITFGTPVIVPINCINPASGCITAVATGGTGTITYSWGGGQTTANICQLTAGTYQVTATDSAGCSASASFILNSPAPLQLTINATPITCNGLTNGSLTAVGSGTGTVIYAWSNLATTATISNLGPGTYCVVATDTLGCTGTACDTLVNPAAIVVQPATVTSVTCTTQGTITANVTGGTGTLNYNWTGGLTGNPLTGLEPGIYCLTVIDGNGCSADGGCDTVVNSGSIVVIDSAQVNPVTCQSAGSIIVFASGGTGALTYTWSVPGITGDSALNLTAGNYSVTVADPTGCSASMTYNVGTQSGAIVIDEAIITEERCFGDTNGCIIIIAEGGNGNLAYSWSNSSTSPTNCNLSVGNYQVTISDNSNCSLSTTYSITQPQPLIVDSAIVTASSCATGGTINVVVSGGTPSYRFAWNNGDTGNPLTGLAGGQYCVVVSDSNGCSATTTNCYTVNTIGNPVNLGAATIDSVACNGGNSGSITANATGGTGTITYSWSSGQTTKTISGLNAGQYCVTASDGSGCSATACYTLLDPPAIIIVTDSITPVGCTTPGAISLTASGGAGSLSYAWSNGATTASIGNLASGGFSVTITDKNLCNLIQSFTVPLGNGAINLDQSNALITNVICFGNNTGSINPNASGGSGTLSYSWSNSSTTSTIGSLVPGIYSLTVTSTGGCSATQSYTVTGPTSGLALTLTTSQSCLSTNVGTACAVVTGGSPAYNYTWSASAADSACISGLQAGGFGITVTDASGCSVSGNGNVGLDNLLGNGQVTEHRCSANPLATYLLAPNASGPGIPPYTYMIDTITGGNVATNNTGQFSGLYPGEYYYVITDSLGCQQSENFPVEPSAALDQFNIQTTPASCTGVQDGSIIVTPEPQDSLDGPFTYIFNDTAKGPDSVFVGVTGGSYQVYVTNAVGCTDTLTATVGQTSTPSVTFNPDTILTANNDTVTLTPIVGGVTSPVYSWSPTTGLDCDTCATPSATVMTSPPINTIVYYVVVSDSANPQCKATDSVVIVVKGQYLMPSAFTPNGDGHNDLFGPVSYSYATIKAFRIYNRWGQMVHNSIAYWDGKFDGKDQPAGAYVYYIEVEYPDITNNDQPVTKKQEGSVVLLR